MKLVPWMVIFSLSLVACSGSKSAKKVSEETPQIELSDADEFIENPVEEPAVALEDSSPEPETIDEAVQVNTSSVASSSFEPGAQRQYTVQKNETLMIIAFKLYGNYERWKELANYNREKLKGSTLVREGMTLSYLAPAEEFIWNPQGNPYLIRTGDTLGSISKNVYNTVKRWKLLWENNRPLIKDPNKIYAGFTLYYLENGREVASEL